MKPFILKNPFENMSLCSFLEIIKDIDKENLFCKINTSIDMNLYEEHKEIWNIIGKILPFNNQKSLIFQTKNPLKKSPIRHHKIDLPNDKSDSYIWINSEDVPNFMHYEKYF